MKDTKALQGQIKFHNEKIESIREFDSELAEKIQKFTNVLIENNFQGCFDVDDDVYHNGIGISQSRLKFLKKSAFNYWYNTYKNVRSNNKRPRHFVDGDFIHRIVFEKETVKDRFVNEEIPLRMAWEAMPDAKKIRATKAYREAISRYKLEGKEIVSAELYNNIDYLDHYFKNEPTLNNLLGNGTPEKAFYTICPNTGLVKKCKTDFVVPLGENTISILDLKSSRNISPGKFDYSIDDYMYYVQGAYYEGIVSAVTGNTVKDYLMLLIEKEAPFECDLRFMDEPSMDAGQVEVDKFLAQLAEYYSAGIFPRNSITLKSCGIPVNRLQDKQVQI